MNSPQPRRRVVEHAACFVCGMENAAGFRIAYGVEKAGTVTADWTPSSRYAGFAGMVHGGALATVLDEAMAKSAVSLGAEAVTGELRVRFRQQVAPGEPLRVRSWLVSRRGRLLKLEASLRAGDGRECCHAWATFVTLPADGGADGAGV